MTLHSRLNNNTSVKKEVFKPKNILPKLEEYPEKGLIMAFTINPKEQYFTSVDRLMKVKDYTKMILSSFYAKYELYFELSPESRIHFHGYIKIYDYFRWVLNDLPQILENFTVAIKPLNDVDAWYDYCDKQQSMHGLRSLIIPIQTTFKDGRETKGYLGNSIRGQFKYGLENFNDSSV